MATAESSTPAGIERTIRLDRLSMVFGVTIGLSALLLFTVEPLVGRLALPVFGGTPGVWTATLAFFQAVLLLGYLYAHLVLRRGLRAAARIHAGVALFGGVAALVAMNVSVADLPLDRLPDVVGVLVLLAAVVGLPAFLLSATTPLLSAWFATTTRRDPYWLYALSNAGSFVGLLAYPFLVEPALGLAAQRTLWTAAVVLLAALLMVAALVATRAGPAGGAASESTAVVRSPLDHPGLRRGRWLLLAAVPAGLLSAVTNVIATDVVSAPLLWVGPLAIYLATFVVAFSPRAGRAARLAVGLAPAAVTLLWVPTASVGGWPIVPLVALEWLCLGVVGVALHGRLAADRPPADRLTDYYLVLSAGGVLGGAFVGIVAPSVFPGIWELPILLVGGLAALAWSGGPLVPSMPDEPGPNPGFAFDPRPLLRGAPARLAPYLAVAFVLALVLVGGRSLAGEAVVRWLLIGALVLLGGGQPWFLTASTALVLLLATLVLPDPALLRARSFFGVTEVLQPAGLDRTVLMNGTTVHGAQWIDPVRRDEPVGYYTRSGPLGDVFGALDALRPNARSIGVVGLGAGGIAAYERPLDAMTFYEIDPVVVAVAADPRYFTYLADAPNRPAVVLGDARRSLAAVPPATHDVLVLDAFSSDAIPAHLLTVEAIADDARVLRPDGLLVVHVSNRYYGLTPAVAAAAAPIGMTVLDRTYDPNASELDAGASPSEWIVATRDPAVIRHLANDGWTGLAPTVRPLTDDHPDLLRFLRP
ncbi:MAG TPA: fused MFS/spermidine synthase [Candidatus Limnocylindrales bacterium]|nr:fused MFS/spermidine synthase [Candidatus Limnocylindrales bacterium]